jgi:uncharacterized membrane protein YhaH (DUF805 family)
MTPARFDLSAFLFNAAGRSGRTAYLVGGLVLPVSIGALLGLVLSPLSDGFLHSLLGGLAGFLLYVLCGVATARRLHDFGLAGWWFALISLVFLLYRAVETGPTWLAWIAASALIAAQLLLLILPGQSDFNRFGPAPAR